MRAPALLWPIDAFPLGASNPCGVPGRCCGAFLCELSWCWVWSGVNGWMDDIEEDHVLRILCEQILRDGVYWAQHYCRISQSINDNHSNARWANQIGLASLRIKWFTLRINNTHLSLCTDDVIVESVIKFCFVATGSGSKCSSWAPEYLSRLIERLVLGRAKGKIWKIWNNTIDKYVIGITWKIKQSHWVAKVR